MPKEGLLVLLNLDFSMQMLSVSSSNALNLLNVERGTVLAVLLVGCVFTVSDMAALTNYLLILLVYSTSKVNKQY